MNLGPVRFYQRITNREGTVIMQKHIIYFLVVLVVGVSNADSAFAADKKVRSSPANKAESTSIEKSVKITEAQMLLIWSKGTGDIYDSQTQITGQYLSSGGMSFDKISLFGDAIVFIWRDFSKNELPKVQQLGLKTGVAYLKTPSGFKMIRPVDLRKSDRELRKEFGL